MKSTVHDNYFLHLQFENRIHVLEGIEFQTFFEKIMENAYSDYKKIKPYGTDGDGGNDGYRKKAGIYYQVYAPKTPKTNESDAANKMYDDFQKLKVKWDDIATIKEYYFVYNNKYEGSTRKLESTITRLESENSNIKFDTFLSDDLEKVFVELQSGLYIVETSTRCCYEEMVAK